EPERLNRAVDLALAYGAAPEALKTTVLRHIAQKRGVRRDRHGRMTVADARATWEVYTALGRLHRRDPKLAKALFPGIHGFVAESVAQGRFGWNPAERDPAARAAILKRIYLDADKKSFEAHKHGLYFLPQVGAILAAPDVARAVAETADHIAQGAWEKIDPLDVAAAAAFPFGGAGIAKGAQSARRGKRAAADPRTAQGTPDPDLHGAGIDWSGRESTQRFFREVYRSKRWRARFARKVPTVGAPEYKGQPIKVGGGRPDVLVGEARLHWDGKRAYALNLQGERVYIDRLPSESAPNITRKPAGDGGWLVTRRLDDGAKVTVYYNRYGLPEFPTRGAFWLPPEVVVKGSRAHRNHVIKQLQEMAHTNPEKLRQMDFSLEQIEKMKKGVNPNTLGIRIHHDYRVGRMLIVDERFHGLAHKGGRSLW
ncbi:MAG: hypothetical protein OXH64_00865, partial [Rhodospirillaceae bacterium]|nr:hypothetical protein [Rhodospirillaceae bacterium]